MNYLVAILVLGLLFGVFAALHLWAGDARPGRCTGEGNCGDCHGQCPKTDGDSAAPHR